MALGTHVWSVVPAWTTGTRPTITTQGMMGFNVTTSNFEGWDGSAWVDLTGGGSGAPTSATYVTVSLNGSLSDERTLDVETGVLSLTDGGANNDITVGVVANGITDAKIRQGAACTVIGRSANSTGNVADIAASTNNRVLARRSNTLQFVQVDLTTDVTGTLPSGNGGYTRPVPPTFSTQALEWMANCSGSANSSQTLGGNTVYYILHWEEYGRTYDAMTPFTVAGVGQNLVCGLYSIGTDGNPLDLLWTSATSSTNTGNTSHILTFAGGTWTAAGASYKDGSNRLVLSAGQGVWRTVMGSGNIQYRVLSSTTCKHIGVLVTGVTGFRGFSEGATYPTNPTTAAAPPTSLTTDIPSLPLRWV